MSNRSNSRHKKDQALSVLQASLPELFAPQNQLPELRRLERQLFRQLSRIEYIRLITQLAQTVGSTTHLHSWLQQVSTTDQAARLKQSVENLTPEVEAVYKSSTAEYLACMEAIIRQFDNKLLEELERTPELLDGLDNRGFWDKLFDWLSSEFD